MSKCQRRGTAIRPSLLYDDFVGTCDSYFENEDSPWKIPPTAVIRGRTSRTAATDNTLKNRLSRLEERVAQLESSKENLTSNGIEIKSFYTDPDDPSRVVGFVSGADRRFRFTEAISLPEAANLPNVDIEETRVIEAPTSLEAEPAVTPPEAPPFDAPPMTPLRSPNLRMPLRSTGDLGIRPVVRRSQQPTLQEEIEMKIAGLRRPGDRPVRTQVTTRGGAGQGVSMMEALQERLHRMRIGIDSNGDNDNGDDEDWDSSPQRRSPFRR